MSELTMLALPEQIAEEEKYVILPIIWRPLSKLTS